MTKTDSSEEARRTGADAATLFDAEVAIVGYGPVGVSAANFLGHYGVRTIVLERDAGIYQRARAVTVNDWTLRAFQSVGLDAALKADMDVNGALRWKTYRGKQVFRLKPRPSDVAGLGHPSSMMIYQPEMEATLRRGVDRFAGMVGVRFGAYATGLEQDADGVTLQFTDADDRQRTLRTRYVLGCDGGSSTIRKALGVKLAGLTHETNWIVVDAEVLRWWPGCNELVFWSDPDRPVVDIPLAMGHHRWEFPLRDGENPADFDSQDAIWNLLKPLGITANEIRLKQHAFYVHHVRHAETWRVGRAFLLGDAAHLMPPWAGQGMQSGIRDAHNLAWKLREVLSGRLEARLLDTYQAERAPNVAAATDLSLRLGMLIASRHRGFIALRNTLGPIIQRLGPLTRVLLPPAATPSITAGWLRGVPAKDNPLGRMIPQPVVCTAAGRRIALDDLLGDGFAVLALDDDPLTLLSRDDAASWQALAARFIAVRDAKGRATAGTDIIDLDGSLRAWMTRYRARVVALRPDRFVAACDRLGLAPPV